MPNSIENITSQAVNRSEQIASVVSKLPEKEQEKIYYMVKGVELAGVYKDKAENRTTV